MAYFAPEELAYIREAVDASNTSGTPSCFKSKHTDNINRLRKDNQNLRDQLDKIMFQGEHSAKVDKARKGKFPLIVR